MPWTRLTPSKVDVSIQLLSFTGDLFSLYCTSVLRFGHSEFLPDNNFSFK